MQFKTPLFCRVKQNSQTKFPNKIPKQLWNFLQSSTLSLLIFFIATYAVFAQSNCLVGGTFTMVSGIGSIQTPFCKNNPIILSGSVSNLDVVAKTIRVTVEFYAASGTSQNDPDLVNDLIPNLISPVTTSTGYDNNAISQYIRYGFDFSVAGGATLPVSLSFVADAVGTVTPEGGPWKVNKIYITAYTTDAQGNKVFCKEGEPKVGLPLSLPNPETLTFSWAKPQLIIKKGNMDFSEIFPSGNAFGDYLFVPKEGSSIPPTITVYGDFTYGVFSALYNFTTAQVSLSPGGKILIPPSSTLRLNQVLINSTCGGLAEGIEVASGGTLIGRRSGFTDSRYGVNAHTASTISFKDQCRFTNNYIGLNLDMQDAPFRANITGFSDVIFETVLAGPKSAYPGMPEPVGSQGYCGIFAKNYRDLNLWGNASFRGMCNGIIGESVTGNFGNMTFDFLQPGFPSSVYPNEGYGIKLSDPTNTKYVHINEPWLTMSINDCQTAISLDGYAGHVKNVSITNTVKGIEWKNSSSRDKVIQKNRITAARIGVESSLNEPNVVGSTISGNVINVTAIQDLGTTSGIRMEETGWGGGSKLQGWRVENNIVNMNGGNGIEYLNGHLGYITANTIVNKGTNQPFSGILANNHSNTGIFSNDIVGSGFLNSSAIESASGFTNAVDCNCVDNTKVGLQFFDMADFSFVEANHVNKHQTGLQLGENGVSNVYIGKQVHTGNTWDLGYYSGTNNDFGGVHWGAPDIVQYSRFFVDATANSSYDPPVNVPDWFIDETSPTGTFICNSTCGVQGPEAPTRTETDLPSDMDAAIVSNTLRTDGYDVETRWKGRYRLYRRLLRRPALEAYAPQYAAFKSAQANLPVGQLAYIAEQRATLFNLSPVQSTTIGTYLGDLNQKGRDLQILDSLQFLGAPIDAQRYTQLSQQARAAAVQYEQYLNGLQATRLQQVQNLQQLNNAVVPDLAPAANQKTVNSILFNLFITNLIASSDLATLQSIAGQCPLEGGDAVYEARSLLRYYTGATFDDRQICTLPNDRHQSKDNATVLAAAEFIVYPNPASSQISWNLQSDGESATVRLYNALGQLQLEQQTTDNHIDVITMPQGIYHLVIQSASGSIRSANFVIQH